VGEYARHDMEGKGGKMIKRESLISELQEAQELLVDALGIIRGVANETDDGMAQGYLIPTLQDCIDHSSNHCNDSVEKMIERLGA